MNKYLVVSYDSDQQQWLYDTVFAPDAEKAGELICTIRPYVLDCDVISMDELTKMARVVSEISPKESARRIAEIAEESGVDEYETY